MMFETVGKLGIPYIMMHMRGTPQTMHGLPKILMIVPFGQSP